MYGEGESLLDGVNKRLALSIPGHKVLGVWRIGNKPWTQVLSILRGKKKVYFLVSVKKVVYSLNTSDFKIRNMG